MADYDTDMTNRTVPADPEVQAILDAWHAAWAAWGEGLVHAEEPLPRSETNNPEPK